VSNSGPAGAGAVAGAPPQALLDGQARNEQLASNGRQLALSLYVMLKSCTMYDSNNRFWERPLSQIAEVIKWHFGDGVGKPLSLASIEKALFINGTLVRLDSSSYGAMRFVTRAFDQMGVEEMSFLGALGEQELHALIAVFRDAIRVRSGEPLLNAQIPGIRFGRKIVRETEEEKRDKLDPRVAAVTAYAHCAASCAEFRNLFLAGGNPTLVRLKRASQELVTTATQHPDLLVGLTQLPRVRGTAAGHMVNCAAYSLLLSRKLKLPRRSFGELALNAMLAPLGVAGREATTVKLSSAEQSEDGDATARVSAAVAMMKRYGALARPALVRSAIVYERSGADGGGRAYRLGMKPHLFSRVIAVAAAYDLAAQDALLDEALRRVVAQARNGALDGDVTALLSETLGLYPVGCTVRLTDGTLAVVVQAPNDPAKRASPIVRVLQGAGGRLVDLSAPGMKVGIAASVPPETNQVNVTHCFLL
jgi:hypothetical protein